MVAAEIETMKFSSHTMAIAFTTLLVTACGRPDLQDYADKTPPFDPAVFFAGDSKAWGIFQDRFGRVRTRFVVDLSGEWEGSLFILTEDFEYDDGRTEQRIWSLSRSGDGNWRGMADGVTVPATGRSLGNAFNFTYAIDLQLADGETLAVEFDDWIWRLDDRTAINRAYVKKFVIEIGEVLIFFQRDDSRE